MGVFDDWAEGKKIVRSAIIVTGCVGLVLLAITQISTIRNWFLVSDTSYQVQLELSPTHLMFGRVGDPDVYSTDIENKLDRDQAVEWTIDRFEDASKARNFAARGVESYTVSIDQNLLTVESTAPSWSAYLYAITTSDMFFEAGLYQGIQGDRPPMLGQLARTLHVLEESGVQGIDLNEYFNGSDKVINSSAFVWEGELILTFHGSNGQFRGELLKIIPAGGGAFSFDDGSTSRTIQVKVRPAHIAVLRGTENNDLNVEFKTSVIGRIAESEILDMTNEQIEDLDGLRGLAERLREVPVNDLRERVLDELAVDFVARINVKEVTEERLVRWSDIF